MKSPVSSKSTYAIPLWLYVLSAVYGAVIGVVLSVGFITIAKALVGGAA